MLLKLPEFTCDYLLRPSRLKMAATAIWKKMAVNQLTDIELKIVVLLAEIHKCIILWVLMPLFHICFSRFDQNNHMLHFDHFKQQVICTVSKNVQSGYILNLLYQYA